MRALRRGCLAVAMSALLVAAGCAVFNPTRFAPGTPVADVRARLGEPTAVHPLADGTRLEYATGPAGLYTWMLDFDAAGTLRAARQVLTDADFNAVQVGLTAQEVRTALGRPAIVERIPRQRQTYWSYRYESPFCQLFHVGIGDDGKVASTSYGFDPRCEVREPAERAR
jgi:hypothetical protein